MDVAPISHCVCVGAVVPKLALHTLCGDACSQKTIDMGGSDGCSMHRGTLAGNAYWLRVSDELEEDLKGSRSLKAVLRYWEDGIAVNGHRTN